MYLRDSLNLATEHNITVVLRENIPNPLLEFANISILHKSHHDVLKPLNGYRCDIPKLKYFVPKNDGPARRQ